MATCEKFIERGIIYVNRGTTLDGLDYGQACYGLDYEYLNCVLELKCTEITGGLTTKGRKIET